jgi:hypothetical protein
VDHQPPLVGEREEDDLEQIAGTVRADGEAFGGSASGSRSNQPRALSIAWRRSSSATPCLNAERWISTHGLW